MDMQEIARRELSAITDPLERLRIMALHGLRSELEAEIMWCTEEGLCSFYYDPNLHIGKQVLPLAGEDYHYALYLMVTVEGRRVALNYKALRELLGWQGAHAAHLLERYNPNDFILEREDGAMRAANGFVGAAKRNTICYRALRAAVLSPHPLNVVLKLLPKSDGKDTKTAIVEHVQRLGQSPAELGIAAVNTPSCYHSMQKLVTVAEWAYIFSDHDGSGESPPLLREAFARHARAIFNLHFTEAKQHRASVRTKGLEALLDYGVSDATERRGTPAYNVQAEVLEDLLAEGEVAMVYQHSVLLYRKLHLVNSEHTQFIVMMASRGYEKAMKAGRYGIAAALAQISRTEKWSNRVSLEDARRAVELALLHDQPIVLRYDAYCMAPPKWEPPKH